MKSFSFFLVLWISVHASWGQAVDYTWWNKHVQWDGFTHWSHYLTMSAGRMGPNALPVPQLRYGSVDSVWVLTAGTHAWGGSGDQTLNGILKLNIPVVPQRVTMELNWVPIEAFRMDTLVRNERNTRVLSGRGTAVGDVHLHIGISLVRQGTRWPDINLGIQLKTASGNALEQARYTDTPGYSFDLTAGKSWELNPENTLRIYGLLGFYVWQTHDEQHPQDDAFSYGLGISLEGKRYRIEWEGSGYVGYLKNGDRPLVVRAAGILKGKRWQPGLSAQYGLHDFPYQGLGIFTRYCLE